MRCPTAAASAPIIPAARSPATRPASRAPATAVSRTSRPSWARRAISAAPLGGRCRAPCAGWAASAVSPATARRAIPEALGALERAARRRLRRLSRRAPRYGHVAAWRRTAMARADRDPRARSERACARCHTTAGVSGDGQHARAAAGRQAHARGVGPVGISCSACHAVHDPKRPRAARASAARPARCRRCSRARRRTSASRATRPTPPTRARAHRRPRSGSGAAASIRRRARR